MAQLVKNLPTMQEDLGSIPGLGRSSAEGKDYPLQYSGLENSMDCIVQGVAKSQTQLSDFHFRRYNFSGLDFGEGNDNPPQYSCLENPMDRGDWRAAVCRIAESDMTK